MNRSRNLIVACTVALVMVAAMLTTACSSGSSGYTRTHVHYGAGYRGYAAMRWQEMAAAAVTAIIPMLFFALVAQRYLVKGLTFGAVK
mgnify:CR=1 FL=1